MSPAIRTFRALAGFPINATWVVCQINTVSGDRQLDQLSSIAAFSIGFDQKADAGYGSSRSSTPSSLYVLSSISTQ
jgi:hypothetical protein